MAWNGYECQGCGAEDSFAAGGVRTLQPCQSCGETTCWEKLEAEA